MREMPLALLVANRPDWSSGLKVLLESRGFAVCAASTCAEATLLLHSYPPPHLVFTDLQLVDGSWMDVLAGMRQSSLPVNAVVVSPHVDVSLYIQVLEQGAFDFIVPPLELSETDHIIRNAMASVEFRRGAMKSKGPSTAQISAEAREEEESHLRDDGFHVTPLV